MLGRLRLICSVWGLEKDAETGITLENFLNNLFQPEAYEMSEFCGS